ncbi:MAG: PorT family protein [Prevotella sp.]|nr:PorT family protein [Prevotella sp.]
MKKLFLIAVAMLATLSVSAQSAPGSFSLKPMVGATLSSVRGSDADGVKMKFGLVAGTEGIYQVSDMFALSGGLLYSMQGFKTDTSLDLKVNTEYLNVPILANVYVARGLALKAGVQLGFLTKAKAKGKYGNIEEDIDIKDSMKSLDLSIPVGVSYEINNSFTIDARYNFGLSKIAKDDDHHYDYTAKTYNSVFMLTLGYKFDM